MGMGIPLGVRLNEDGNLDVTGVSIITTNDGNIIMIPGGTGQIGFGSATLTGEYIEVVSADSDQVWRTIKESVGGQSTLDLQKARGVIGAPTAVLDGDLIGSVAAHGYGDTDYFSGGKIQFFAAGDFSDSSAPVDLEISMAPVGSTTKIVRFRLGSKGNLVNTIDVNSTYNPASLPLLTTPGVLVRNANVTDNDNYAGVQMSVDGSSGFSAYGFIGVAREANYGPMVLATRGADGFVERVRIDVDNVNISGSLSGLERSSDPAEPAEGSYVIWMSNGTSSRAGVADGDVVVASKVGGATKFTIIHDHSAGAAW